MYEQYEEPNYNPGGQAEQPKGMQMPNFSIDASKIKAPEVDAKKILPIIAAAAVIIIIGLAALYFINSNKSVKFNIVDPDGKNVDTILIVKDSQNKSVALSPKGLESQFSATLFIGKYTYTATTANYKSVRGKTFEVTAETTTIPIEMERNINATITSDFDYTEIYEGQTLSGKINVINDIQSDELEFEAKDIYADTNSGSILEITLFPSLGQIIIDGSHLIDFNVKIKSGQTITKTKTEKFQFKIKGTKIKGGNKTISALPSIQKKDIQLTPTSLSNTSLKAADLSPVQTVIKVKNNNKTLTAKNVTLTIIPTSGEQFLEWFRFNQAQEESPETITIPSIGPGATENITLIISPPATAKKGNTFTGFIRTYSPSIKEPLTQDMRYVIATEKTAYLVIEGTKTQTITCDKDTFMCQTKSYANGEIKITNKGTIEITNITIEKDPLNNAYTPNCDSYMTKLVSTSYSLDPTKIKIPSLQPGKSEPLIVEFTAPPDEADKSTAVCVIKITYIDPTTSPAKTVVDYEQFEITKTIS